MQINESEYEITSITNESITGKITAVYNVNNSSSDKNTIYIEVKLVYEDGYWKLNDYKEED